MKTKTKLVKPSRIGFSTVEPEILPRHRTGCDYGADGQVLFRRRDRIVFSQPGTKFTSGIGMQSYGPASVSCGWSHSYDNQTLWEGRTNTDKIDAAIFKIADWLHVSPEDVRRAIRAIRARGAWLRTAVFDSLSMKEWPKGPRGPYAYHDRKKS